MIIKIQKAVFSSDGGKPFLIYNRARTFETQIHEGETGYDELDKFFQKHDKGDHKIYVKAIHNSDGMLMLHEVLKYPEDKRTNF